MYAVSSIIACLCYDIGQVQALLNHARNEKAHGKQVSVGKSGRQSAAGRSGCEKDAARDDARPAAIRGQGVSAAGE
ncbi:hypothetical protein D3C80_2089030 [compost metagenome]